MRFLSDKLRLQRLAAFSLPLFLLGLLLDAHHQAAFEHEVCSVDGELAHAEDGHEHESLHDSSEHDSDEDGDHDEEHEHCGMSTLGTDADSPPSGFVFGLALVDSTDLTRPALEFTLVRESLYRSAPKNSQPLTG